MTDAPARARSVDTTRRSADPQLVEKDAERGVALGVARARRDDRVKTHPKRTVTAAGDVVHRGRRRLDRTLGALAARGLVD